MKERLQKLTERATRAAAISLALAGLKQPVFAEGEANTYTVKLDDNLWTLAEKYLGSGERYSEIVTDTNKMAGENPSFATIDNPILIHPGQKLVIPTGIRSNKAAWPETQAQAATIFGGIPERWETTADPGGWHLREEAERTIINPSGYPLEGYYDTKPGRDPRQFVSAVAIDVQGCTVWRDATPEQLFCAMVAQKYPGLSYNQVRGLIDAVGFTKPVSCRRE